MNIPDLPHGFHWGRHLVAGSHDYGDLNLLLDHEWIATIRRRISGDSWVSTVRRYAEFPHPSAITKTREASVYYVVRWTIAHEASIRVAVADKQRRRRAADPMRRLSPEA